MIIRGLVIFLLVIVVVATYVPAPTILRWDVKQRKLFAAAYMAALLVLLVLALVSAYYLYVGKQL